MAEESGQSGEEQKAIDAIFERDRLTRSVFNNMAADQSGPPLSAAVQPQPIPTQSAMLQNKAETCDRWSVFCSLGIPATLAAAFTVFKAGEFMEESQRLTATTVTLVVGCLASLGGMFGLSHQADIYRARANGLDI